MENRKGKIWEINGKTINGGLNGRIPYKLLEMSQTKWSFSSLGK